MIITSLQNDQVKELVRLRNRRDRDRTGRFVIEGYREIRRATDAGVRMDTLFVCPPLFLGPNEDGLISEIRSQGVGVVELAAGNAQGAMAAYDVAIKLSPNDAQAYVGRAEVKLSMGQKSQAIEDLRRASSLAPEGDAVGRKAEAMIFALSRR